MKKMLNVVLLVAAGAFAGGEAFAQASASASASASATVVQPLAIIKTADLVFGNLVASGTAGSTTISAADGSRTVDGGVSLVPGSTGSPSAALFNVSGEPSFSYVITLPSSVTLTGAGESAPTMTVDTFSVASTTGGQPGALSNQGTQTIRVGAKLTVAQNQVPDTYSGTFNVSVDYN